MKNVTIPLPDEIAQRARVEAAKAGKSLSRSIGELVQSGVGAPPTATATLRQFLASYLQQN